MQQYLLTLLLKLGVVTSLASILVRSNPFKRMLMQEQHLTYPEAAQYVWSTTVFTTHTPVPAGNFSR